MFSKQRGRGRGAFNLNLQGHGDFKMNQQGRNHGKENNIFGQQGPINENIPSKVTAAERAKRFGSTSKSAIYDKVSTFFLFFFFFSFPATLFST